VSNQPVQNYPVATKITTITQTNSGEQNLSNPGDFGRWYFTAVWQNRNYEYLWTLWTSRAQAKASPGGYKEFTTWWGSMDRVDISSVNVLNNDGKYASIQVIVTFHIHDGRVLQDRKYSYDLIFDANRNTWMFDYR
jgi:hypothetical protein